MHAYGHTYITLPYITSYYITLHQIPSHYIAVHSVHTYRPAYLHHAVPLYIRLDIYEHMENQIKKKNNMCIHMACIYCSAAFTSFMVNSETGTSETCWSNKKNSAASLGHDVTIWVDYQRALAKHKQNPHFNSNVWHLCCIWS